MTANAAWFGPGRETAPALAIGDCGVTALCVSSDGYVSGANLRSFLSACVALLCLGGATAAAGELDAKQSLTVFAGRFTAGDIGQTLIFSAPWEDNGLVAVAYQRKIADLPWRFHFSAEAGLAARFGERFSGEVWAAGVLGHRGVKLGSLNIAPSFALGLSAITAPMGHERDLAVAQGADPTLLFYLGPEFSFSLDSHPEYELVWRTHHRSGAWGVLGNMKGGYNGTMIGLRRRF